METKKEPESRDSRTRESRRFSSTSWQERLIPILLVLLLFGLVATLAIVGLSVAGVIKPF